MKESSWREQEAQDRRLAELEEQRARLAFDAQAARAEAEAARGAAALQRRLAAKRSAADAAAAGGGQEGGGGAAQVVELLQKRVRVLEAQNQKLRLAAAAAEAEAATDAKPAPARGRRAAGSGGAAAVSAGSEPADTQQGAPASGAGEAAENGSPNRAAEAAGEDAEDASGSGGSGGLLGRNPVLQRWAADKRLQRRVEALQAKLKVGGLRELRAMPTSSTGWVTTPDDARATGACAQCGSSPLASPALRRTRRLLCCRHRRRVHGPRSSWGRCRRRCRPHAAPQGRRLRRHAPRSCAPRLG